MSKTEMKNEVYAAAKAHFHELKKKEDVDSQRQAIDCLGIMATMASLNE